MEVCIFVFLEDSNTNAFVQKLKKKKSFFSYTQRTFIGIAKAL
jgi:hypothetical protein